MTKWLVVLLTCGALDAAIIKGSVVENQTGKALARAAVTIQPVAGSQGPSKTARTNTYGMFEFADLPAGAYLLHAARRGFMRVEFGQKSWRAAGQPVVVEQDQSVFVSVRMLRFASISGMIVDENDVGLPEHEVVAMSNTRPPRVMAKAQADDRGMYRISGLDPGTYLVRSLARAYEEGGYLPTFHRETLRVDEAGTVDTMADQETMSVKVRPLPGRLFTISGRAQNSLLLPMTVTLASDVGRETVTTSGPFQFSDRAPGNYELLLETVPDRRGTLGAYVPISLERDMTGVSITLLPVPTVNIDLRSTQGGRLMDSTGVKMMVRRVDMAGVGQPEALSGPAGGSLLPGRWQIRLAPSPVYVAAEFRGPRGEQAEGGRADGWNEFTVGNSYNGMRYVLSNKPGAVHGAVYTGAHEPAAGVPVFLEAYSESGHKRMVELLSTRTDMKGQYNFVGLAPGTYRLVSTFEYREPETADIDGMSPRVFLVEEGRDQQQDLDVWAIR